MSGEKAIFDFNICFFKNRAAFNFSKLAIKNEISVNKLKTACL